jgi:hypothetical protein
MPTDIKITVAGEPSSAVNAFSKVGSSAKKMQADVGSSTDGFDKVGRGFDDMDTRAMGFRDTITGVQDTMGGLSELSKGPSAEGFLTLGAGIGDLGSGMYNTLIPALKSTTTWLKSTRLAAAATAVWSGICSAATKVWAGIQMAFNAIMMMNPIALIIIAIIALIAIIVIIATKTTWFQTAWKKSWSGIKAAFEWSKDAIGKGVDWVSAKVDAVIRFMTSIPGRIRSAFTAVASIVSAPYRAGFNAISKAWNQTVGRLSWTVPSWVPGLGGGTISAPRLPTFHRGGTVPGAPGADVLAILQAGERVTPAAGGSPTVIELRSDGTALGELLVDVLARTIGTRGGNVQVVLGGAAA